MEAHQHQEDNSPDHIQKVKTLICALNFVSRNLPLPPHIFDAVSSIYHDGRDDDDAGGDSLGDRSRIPPRGDLIADFEEALAKERSSCMTASLLGELKEKRYQSRIKNRLSELEELPSTRGENLQTECLIELFGLKLLELQRKVRSEVSAEYWLSLRCASPDKQLFDWGMMRLRGPPYGIGDPFVTDVNDQFKKKRDVERLSRLEEEERNQIESRKRRFFAHLRDAVREFKLQIQASLKMRKQRNDGVLTWHGRKRQRATRAEKLRFQALKANDQETYMKLVKESKNERLTALLEETNKILVNLGAVVQCQKECTYTDDVNAMNNVEDDSPRPDTREIPVEAQPDNYLDITDYNQNDDGNDLLEGQRRYNSAIYSIQEKVTEQPSILRGRQLRSYQLEGLQWMLSLFNNNLNGILADEMGLGKTIQTISFLAYLKEKKGISGPHLIIAPKGVLPNWIIEFSTWLPEDEIKVVLYDGHKDERKALMKLLLRGKFDVLITHYDLVIKDQAFLKKFHWHYVVVDEAHRLKNHKSRLAKTLSSGFQILRRLLLTGTPIQNKLDELWSLLNFILPNIFNSSEKFEEWFNAPFADKSDVSLAEEEELLVIRRLHQVIRPFLLRRKKDEVEKHLPRKSRVILKCDMSAWQKVYYQQILETGKVGLPSGYRKSKNLQNPAMQLRKCCNHPYLFFVTWPEEDIVRASGKFELLDRLLPKLYSTGHRVLFFSQMTKLLNIFEVYLQCNGYKYLKLVGSTKTEERGALIKKFNDPESPYFIFLLSTHAGGVGLNLQTADTVIFFDRDWNPQMDLQAEDRAHRIGQEKEVRVFVLVSEGSIDEVILEHAEQKMGIDAKVIQAGLFNEKSTDKDRSRMLEIMCRKILEEVMHRASSLGTGVHSDQEINRLAARTQEEFRIFEDMDKERGLNENYRSRLMEHHEVPELVYLTPNPKEDKGKGSEENDTAVLGKRRRKVVTYADASNDLQWLKAIENGEGISKLSTKGKKREHQPYEDMEPASSSAGLEKEAPEMITETALSESEETNENTSCSAPKRIKFTVGADKAESRGL